LLFTRILDCGEEYKGKFFSLWFVGSVLFGRLVERGSVLFGGLVERVLVFGAGRGYHFLSIQRIVEGLGNVQNGTTLGLTLDDQVLVGVVKSGEKRNVEDGTSSLVEPKKIDLDWVDNRENPPSQESVEERVPVEVEEDAEKHAHSDEASENYRPRGTRGTLGVVVTRLE
jgi:hypothetical protein